MRAYIIRFAGTCGGGFAEIVGGTEADAREEFQRRNPDFEIYSSHEKPFRQIWDDQVTPVGDWPIVSKKANK